MDMRRTIKLFALRRCSSYFNITRTINFCWNDIYITLQNFGYDIQKKTEHMDVSLAFNIVLMHELFIIQQNQNILRYILPSCAR